MKPMKRTVLAVDIGGSKLLTALVTAVESFGQAEGQMIGKIEFTSRRPLFRESGKDGVLRAVIDSVAETLTKGGRTIDGIDGIGVTIPGLADPVAGVWLYAPFSGIRDFPIAAILREKYRRPVLAENDVNACAWGERVFGVCHGVDDFLWITVSNGIGGGLVLGGEIYRGHFGGAAEIGHFKMVENGALCGCGHHGCLEAEGAGPAIARRFTRLVAEEKDAETRRNFEERIAVCRCQRGLIDDNPLSAAEIATLARDGFSPAIRVFETTGWLLGRAAAWSANLINPAAIVVGGGVAGAFDLFGPAMKKTFADEAMTGPNRNVRILPTGLGYEAGLYAAASLLFGKKDSVRECSA